MKAYEEYKEIGLPWLEKIPSHWNIVKNKNVFLERKTTVGDDSGKYILLSLSLNGIIPRDVESGKGKFPKDFNTYKMVEEGDMAFCLFDMDETPRTVGLSNYRGMLTGAYTIFDITNMDEKYVYYYYLGLDNIKAFRPLYTGLRKTISTSVFMNLKLPMPELFEQKQIVSYLDWKLTKINSLVKAEKKKIELLEERKKQLIDIAVTQGISDAALVSSEVPWLKQRPSHWESRRIKYLFDMRDERNYLPLSEVNLISLYTKLGVIQNSDIEYTSGNKATNADGYKKVQENDIIVNIILCWMGAVGRSAYTGVTSPAYDIYIPKENVSSRYYHYLFRTSRFSEQCYKAGKGIMAMRWRTYSPQFCNIWVPVPPFEEQEAIANWLDEKIKSIDSMIIQIEHQVELLRELKNRIVLDVVTGKIDVRGIDIPEYEHVEDIYDNDDELMDGEYTDEEV